MCIPIENIKDFSKLFFPLKKSSIIYNEEYAFKADKHAMNEQSKNEVHWVSQNTNPKKAILDIGCNTGKSLGSLYDLWDASEGVGVDINSDALLIAAKQNLTLSFQLYDGQSLDFSSESFDHVMLHHVLYHVQFPEKILNEAFRVLKIGGTLSVITPNFWYKFWQFPMNIYRRFLPDLTILRYYHQKSLKRALQNAGFTIDKFETYGPLPSISQIDSNRLRLLVIAKKI